MSRWAPDAQGRLERAALELYGQRGFGATTVAEIAERAGLTERTFFRYYADKREVLFHGADHLRDELVGAVTAAPEASSPLAAVAAALDAAAAIFESRPGFVRLRQAIVSTTPELQERELRKLAMLAERMAGALRERGVPDVEAHLAGEVGITVLKVGFDRWTARGATGSLADEFAGLLATLGGLTGGVQVAPLATPRGRALKERRLVGPSLIRTTNE